MFFKFILLFLFITFSDSICPDKSIPFFNDETQCISFHQNKTQFLNAEKVCMDLGGHLSSIHNSLNNMFLSQQAMLYFTDSSESDFWFGVSDLVNYGNFSWLDNSPFDFTNWEKNQPQNTSGTNCGAIIMENGEWIVDDCYKMKPFVCLVQAFKDEPSTTTTTTTTTMKPKKCPEAWKYYETTGFCYIFLHNNSWLNAETQCNIEGGHLASIHSLDEDLFVAHLVQPSYAWIGLYTEDNNAHWKWTDGTPFDYSNWRSGEPNLAGKENCVNILSQGDFNNWICNEPANYVCKILPS